MTRKSNKFEELEREKGRAREREKGDRTLMAGDSSANLGWRSQRGNCVTSKCVHAQTRAVESEIRARASKIPKPGRNPQEGCVLEHMPRYYSAPRCCPRADESADNSLRSTNTDISRRLPRIISHEFILTDRFERNCLQAVIFSPRVKCKCTIFFEHDLFCESSSSVKKKEIDGNVEEEIGDFFLFVL